ncbi:MAG: hypothetical protein ACRC6J_01790 [Cetobacterium sp.]
MCNMNIDNSPKINQKKENQIKTVNSVQEFMMYIQNLTKDNKKEFVFRGQRDENWNLVPSVFRDGFYKNEDKR